MGARTLHSSTPSGLKPQERSHATRGWTHPSTGTPSLRTFAATCGAGRRRSQIDPPQQVKGRCFVEVGLELQITPPPPGNGRAGGGFVSMRVDTWLSATPAMLMLMLMGVSGQ